MDAVMQCPGPFQEGRITPQRLGVPAHTRPLSALFRNCLYGSSPKACPSLGSQSLVRQGINTCFLCNLEHLWRPFQNSTWYQLGFSCDWITDQRLPLSNATAFLSLPFHNHPKLSLINFLNPTPLWVCFPEYPILNKRKVHSWCEVTGEDSGGYWRQAGNEQEGKEGELGCW